VPGEDFRKRADELFRLAPVRHLILIEMDDKVLRSPHLGRAPTLEFRTFWGKIRTLVRSPHLKSVTGLILRFGGLEDGDAMELANASTLDGLTTLDLYRCSIGPAGVRALATSPNLAGVRDLVLGGNSEVDEEEGVGDALAAALAGPDVRMTRLERLHLSYCRIGDAGARALAAAPALAALRSLDLAYNQIGHAGARALAESPHLKSLKRLNLRGNALGRQAQQALSERHGKRVNF
jgi:hypothetical protein